MTESNRAIFDQEQVEGNPFLSPEAERFLKDEKIQAGLGRVFDSFDGITSELKDKGAAIEKIPSGITSDGTYVELSIIRDYPETIDGAYSEDVNGKRIQLLAYAFNIANVVDPDFKPDPIKMTKFGGWRRGPGQSLMLENQGDKQVDESLSFHISTGLAQAGIRHYRDKECKLFRDIRKQLGVTIPSQIKT